MNETKDLRNKEAIDKLKELVDEIQTCLFCTRLGSPDETTCRPMGVQKVCDQGNLWFFSNINSDKNKHILEDGRVQLYFAHPAKSTYLVVNGTAKVVVDRSKTEELWTPVLKAWFEQGKDDPEISILKVTPTSAYYWDTDGNKMINFLKMVSSVVTGKNQMSGREGSISIS